MTANNTNAHAPSTKGDAAPRERWLSQRKGGKSPLSVHLFGFTPEIDRTKREPKGYRSRFVSNSNVIAFVSLRNSSAGIERVRIRILNPLGDIGVYEDAIPPKSKRWRTWGTSGVIGPKGRYQAVVEDSAGRVISGPKSFVISGSE